MKSRDYVTNGDKKYFIVAFKADENIAYVCNCDTQVVETELIGNIKKEEGQCTINSFVKARAKFQQLIQEKLPVEKESTSTTSRSKSSKPKKRVITKPTKVRKASGTFIVNLLDRI